MGTTAAQKKLFFNLRRMKGEIKALEDGDLKPEHLTKIATDLGVKESEVTSMNRRMSGGGDSSLNVTIGGEDGPAEWQDWLTDCLLYTSPSPRDLSTSRMPSSA